MNIKHYGSTSSESVPAAFSSYIDSFNLIKFIQNGKLVLVFELDFATDTLDIELFTQNQKYVKISSESPNVASLSNEKRIRAEIDVADLTWSADIVFLARITYRTTSGATATNHDFVYSSTYYLKFFYVNTFYTLTLPINIDLTVNTTNITDHDIYYNLGETDDSFKGMRNDYSITSANWSKIDSTSVDLADLEDLNLVLMPQDKTDVEVYWNYGTTGSRVYAVKNVCDKLFPQGDVSGADFKIEIDSISLESNDKIADFSIIWTRSTDLSMSFDVDTSGYTLDGENYFTTLSPRVNFRIPTLLTRPFNFPESNGYIQRDGMRYPSRMYGKLEDTGDLQSFQGTMFGLDNDTPFMEFGTDFTLTNRFLEPVIYAGFSRYYVEEATTADRTNAARILLSDTGNRYAPPCISATRTAENTLTLVFDGEVAAGFSYNLRFEDLIVGAEGEELDNEDITGLTWSV